MEVVGVRAVIDGVQAYVSGAQKVNAETAKMASTADKAAKDSEASSSRLAGAIEHNAGHIVALLGGAAAGFASFKGLESSVEFTQELAAEVSKLSRETGLSTEEASRWIATFKHFGLEGDDASRALGILAKKLKGVQDEETGLAAGGKSTAALLADIGISATDAEGNLVPLGELIPEIADHFKSLPDGVEKTGLAMQLFGRSGKDLIPILNLGADGIKEMNAEADKLGVVLTSKNLAAIKGYTFAQRNLKEAIGGIKLQIGLALIPALTAATNFITNKAIPVVRSLTSALKAKLENAGVLDFLRQAAKVLQTLGPYLVDVAKNGDLLNDFLADVPRKGRPVAIVLGSLVEIGKQVVRDFEDIARAGQEVLQFVGRLTSKVADFLPKGGNLDRMLARIGANAGGIKAIAGAVTGFIAVLATAEVLNFAAAIGTMAGNILTFPVKLLGNAVDTITGFGRAATNAAADAEAAANKVAGVAGTKAADTQGCIDKTATCTEQVKVTGDEPITGEPITKDITENVTVKQKTDPKSLGVQLGLKLAGGIAQGIGVVLAPLIIAALIAAGVGAGTIAIVVGIALAVAIAGALIFYFRKEIASGFVKAFEYVKDTIVPASTKAIAAAFNASVETIEHYGPVVGRAILAVLENVPRVVAFIAGQAVASLVLVFVALPLKIEELFVKGIVGAAKRAVPLMVTAFVEGAKGILRGLQFLHDDLPRLLGEAALLAVKASMKAFEFLEHEAPKLIIHGVSEGTRKLPGFFIEAGKGILRGLAFLHDGLPRLLGEAVLAAVRLSLRYLHTLDHDVPEIIVKAFVAGVKSIPGLFTAMFGLIGAAFDAGWSVVKTITGAALEFIRNLISGSRLAELAGAIMDQVVGGFQQGWDFVNRVSGGALQDLLDSVAKYGGLIVGEVASIPGQLAGFAADFLNAGLSLGGAIFDGIMAGLKQAPGMVDAFLGGVKDAIGAAINAAVDAINNAIPDDIGFSVLGHHVGIDIPDNPIPHVQLAKGTAGLPFPSLAMLGEYGRELAFLPAGTAVAPTSTTNAIMAALGTLTTAKPRQEHAHPAATAFLDQIAATVRKAVASVRVVVTPTAPRVVLTAPAQRVTPIIVKPATPQQPRPPAFLEPIAAVLKRTSGAVRTVITAPAAPVRMQPAPAPAMPAAKINVAAPTLEPGLLAGIEAALKRAAAPSYALMASIASSLGASRQEPHAGTSSTVSALMGALAGLSTPRGTSAGMTVALTIPIDATVQDLTADVLWNLIKSRVPGELDRQVINARSRARRAGANISSALG